MLRSGQHRHARPREGGRCVPDVDLTQTSVPVHVLRVQLEGIDVERAAVERGALAPSRDRRDERAVGRVDGLTKGHRRHAITARPLLHLGHAPLHADGAQRGAQNYTPTHLAASLLPRSSFFGVQESERSPTTVDDPTVRVQKDVSGRGTRAQWRLVGATSSIHILGNRVGRRSSPRSSSPGTGSVSGVDWPIWSCGAVEHNTIQAQANQELNLR